MFDNLTHYNQTSRCLSFYVDMGEYYSGSKNRRKEISVLKKRDYTLAISMKRTFILDFSLYTSPQHVPSSAICKPHSHTTFPGPLSEPHHLLGGKINFEPHLLLFFKTIYVQASPFLRKNDFYPHFLRFCNEIRCDKHRTSA